MSKKTYLGFGVAVLLVSGVISAAYLNATTNNSPSVIEHNEAIYLEGDNFHEKPPTNPNLHFEKNQLRITDITVQFDTPIYEQIGEQRYVYYFPYQKTKHTDKPVEGYHSENITIEAYMKVDDDKLVELRKDERRTKTNRDDGVLAYLSTGESKEVVLIVRSEIPGSFGGVGEQWFKVRKKPFF